MAGQPATRTEVRLRKMILAQSRATFAIATQAQTSQGCAMRSVCLPLPASKLQDGSVRSTLDAVLLIGTVDPLLARTDPVARKRMSRRTLPARSKEVQTSLVADVEP